MYKFLFISILHKLQQRELFVFATYNDVYFEYQKCFENVMFGLEWPFNITTSV